MENDAIQRSIAALMHVMHIQKRHILSFSYHWMVLLYITLISMGMVST